MIGRQCKLGLNHFKSFNNLRKALLAFVRVKVSHHQFTWVRKRLMFLTVVSFGWVPVWNTWHHFNKARQKWKLQQNLENIRNTHNSETDLNSILFCWQSKSIPPHRMQHIISLHSFVSSKNVCGSISQWMANVKPSSTAKISYYYGYNILIAIQENQKLQALSN